MKKILLMSLCLLISSISSARFSYASEERDFIYELPQLSNIQYELSTINDPISMNLIDDESVLDYIDASTPMFLTMNEAFILEYTESDNSTTNKNPDDSNAENILTSTSPALFMMPPPSSKSKSSNSRKKVELTEIEKKEIRRIFNAGEEGLNKLNKRDRKTWQKIFDEGLTLDACFKKKLKQKNHREANKRYRAKPDVREREKRQQRKYRKEWYSKPESKEYMKEYYAKPEVKEWRKEHNRKRNRSVSQLYPEIDKRPTKKRKIE